MDYTIKQAAIKTGLSEHTLRYYDREGLLPLLKRSESNIRKFTENDLAWIGLICCLKDSGMPIGKIKEFMLLCLEGTKTSVEKKQLLIEHKAYILEQIENLKKNLSVIDYKIEHSDEIGVFHIDIQE